MNRLRPSPKIYEIFGLTGDACIERAVLAAADAMVAVSCRWRSEGRTEQTEQSRNQSALIHFLPIRGERLAKKTRY